MTRRGVLALVVLVAAASAAGGLAVRRWWVLPGEGTGTVGVRADAVFTTRLTNLAGGKETLERWRGNVLVVNFWATWCAPCREEIPLFVRMQKRYDGRGVQFVGIAIDRPEPVAAFQREYGMNYPVLLGGLETMDLMRLTGNRTGVLPYTLVINRNGKIAHYKIGGLKEGELQDVLSGLL